MSANSDIEWTDATWNPIRGCSRVSEGCRNCYAEGVAYRFSGHGQPYEGLVRIGADGKRRREWNGLVQFVDKHLLDPLKWKEPKRIFVNSMSDLFHENVKDEWLDRIFAVMAMTPEHTYQVLTKRPGRMLKYLTALYHADRVDRIAFAAERIRGGWLGSSDWLRNYAYQPGFDYTRRIPPIPNVHLGVSCEDRDTKHRIDTLREVPAALRFLSLEPLLEDLGELDLSGIGWVIVGGESGPGARPCDVAWIRNIMAQCETAGVPVFVKQLGSVPIESRDADGVFVPDYEYHFRDKKGGDMEEWPDDLQVREFPKEQVIHGLV